MATKTYRAWTWPNLSIGCGPIKFVNGTYSTDNEEEQAQIESAHGYGSRIVDVTEAPPDEIPFEEPPAGESTTSKRGKWRPR